MKHFLNLFFAFTVATQLSAQSMVIHTSDGGKVAYRMAAVDSVVFDHETIFETPRNQTANLTLDITTDLCSYTP